MKAKKTIKPEKDKLIKSVFDLDIDTFMAMVENGEFDEAYCQDTHIFNDVVFPLHHITICWDIIFSFVDEWKEEFRETLRTRKAKNDQLKEYFAKQLGLDMNVNVIKFSDYHNHFYCMAPDDDIEECLCESEETLRKIGLRDIDIELAWNVERFNYEEVKRLLDEGANPGIDYSDDGENCLSRIYSEIQFIYSEFQDNVLGKEKIYDIHDISYLIGLAAHEKMDHLLDSR